MAQFTSLFKTSTCDPCVVCAHREQSSEDKYSQLL